MVTKAIDFAKEERDDSYPFFPTDVYSFHVDRSPVPLKKLYSGDVEGFESFLS